jgi:hypothetical protein
MIRLLVKAKHVDPSQMDLFGGGNDTPLQQKKTWVRHPKTGKMFQRTVYVRTDKNESIGRQIGREQAESYVSSAIGKLKAENARNLSDAEIERIFTPTAGGQKSVERVKGYRDSGKIKLSDIGYDPSLDPSNVQRMAEGAKKQHEFEEKKKNEFLEQRRHEQVVPTPLWTKMSNDNGEDHDILQVPGSKMAAIPVTGRKSSSQFVIVDTETREEVVNPIGKDDVRLWLIRHAESEGLPKHEDDPEPANQEILSAPGVSEDDIPYDLAREAYYFSSMDPDRRARVERSEYVERMNRDYTDLKEVADKHEASDILDEEFDRYRKGYIEKVKAYLSANSRTASSAVTGSANFPVERNRRRMETANRRSQEAEEFRKKALNAIKRKLNPDDGVIRSGEADTVGKLTEKLGRLEKLQETMKAANKVVRSKGSDADKIRRLQEVGLSEDQAKQALIPDYMGRQGFPEFALRNNNAEIKRVRDRLDQEKRRETVAAATSDEDRVKRFDGGEVELDYDDNRIRIRHDEKPSAEVRSQLKSRGFRWSPKNGAWQRQLTDNAKRVTSQITGVEL